MKTIAYSCAAEGRGHVTGLLAVSFYLKQDYQLVFFCPDRVAPLIREQFPNHEIIPVPGLFFPSKGEKLDYLRLILYGAKTFFMQGIYTARVVKLFKEKGISACISDFEPYTVRAARRLRLPRLQLNHIGALLTDSDRSFGARLYRFGCHLIQTRPIPHLYTSFYNGDVGPLLRQEIIHARPSSGSHFVCYLPPYLQVEVEAFAKAHPETEFRFFPNPKEDYIAAFASARGIISLGGHQTICEALYLQKPILTFQMNHQYEQTLNCVQLEKTGRGLVGDRKDVRGSLEHFLSWIEGFPYPPASTGDRFSFEDDSKRAAEKVVAFLTQAGVAPNDEG